MASVEISGFILDFLLMNKSYFLFAKFVRRDVVKCARCKTSSIKLRAWFLARTQKSKSQREEEEEEKGVEVEVVVVGKMERREEKVEP